jgi:hypothetical protein
VGNATIRLVGASDAVAIMSSDPVVEVGLFFHVGYAVQDLNGAMAQFSTGLGIEWGDVTESTLPVRFKNGQVQPVSFRTVYSTPGLPFIELAQAQLHSPNPDNPWAATEHARRVTSATS